MKYKPLSNSFISFHDILYLSEVTFFWSKVLLVFEKKYVLVYFSFQNLILLLKPSN